MYSVLIQQAGSSEQVEIHSPYVDELKLFDTKLVKAVGAIDSFSFSIYPTHPNYSDLHYLTTLIEVWNVENNKLLFKGRVLEPEDSMSDHGELRKDLICESELAYLHDTVQKWAKWQNLSPAQFFAELIKVHNEQVESYKQFRVGRVEITTSTDNLYRFTDDETSTFDTIDDKLVSRLGGELQVRYEAGVKYLDYLKEIGQKGDQKIELSRNLRSIKRKLDPSELITVLKPLGAYIKNEYEEENEDEPKDVSKPRWTIGPANFEGGGSDYLEDKALVAQFGRIVKAKVWDNVELMVNLIDRGKEFLANQKTAIEQFQIDAVDLSLIGRALDSFECGWTYDVYNPLMGIDEPLRVVGISIDLNDPTAGTMNIGDKILSQEDYNKVIRNQAKRIQSIIIDTRNSFNQVDSSIGNISKEVKALEILVNSGTPAIQNQISSIFSELKVIAEELKRIDEKIPTVEKMQEISNTLTLLVEFKTAQEAENERIKEVELKQIEINEKIETRLAKLENPEPPDPTDPPDPEEGGEPIE